MNTPENSMFLAAVQSLAEISKALDIPDDEAACANGNELILEAIKDREEMLCNLLAVIHRDGGHYVAEHGLHKAAAEAEDKIVQWLARDDSTAHADALYGNAGVPGTFNDQQEKP